MKSTHASNKSKVLTILFLTTINLLSHKVTAQDIIVKPDKSRINTHVLIANDAIVNCRGLENNGDTIFSLQAYEIEFILFEKGNIKQHAGNVSLKTNLDKKDQEPYVEAATKNTIKSGLQDTPKQPQAVNRKLIHAFDIGAGITAARLLNRVYSNYDILPFQINLRYTRNLKNPSAIGLGINLNYSNIATIIVAPRYSMHGVGQIYFLKRKDYMIYLNGMAGIAFFNYNHSQNSGILGDTQVFLPSAHAGIGFKSYWSDNSGYFIETGIGGPYLINAGVFF